MGCTKSKAKATDLNLDETSQKIKKAVLKLDKMVQLPNSTNTNMKVLLKVELIVREVIYDIICYCNDMEEGNSLHPSIEDEFKRTLDSFSVKFPSIARNLNPDFLNCLRNVQSRTFNDTLQTEEFDLEKNNFKISTRSTYQSDSEKQLEEVKPNLYERRKGKSLSLNKDIIIDTDRKLNGLLDITVMDEVDANHRVKTPKQRRSI